MQTFLYWGRTLDYEKAGLSETNYLTKHSIKISGLDPDSEYFFKLKITDYYGNENEYKGQFKTLPLPAITEIIEEKKEEEEKEEEKEPEKIITYPMEEIEGICPEIEVICPKPEEKVCPPCIILTNKNLILSVIALILLLILIVRILGVV
ncbi:MAG: hypothetical protein QME57_01465 [Patescibacteria group bacterium]|nr:hypothetical protein [Patescibacteria group bacterium]